MATYLPGVVDYIPQIQPFRPDYNFYSGALQMKQGQYDAAHKQLSNLYGSLLNAPMLRDQNIEARDQFFKAINNDIQKISGLDLSLQENVTAASNLFTQIYDNQNIVKDMVWTKNYQSELTRAENFRNCVDIEKCGGAYWEGGVKALNYKADEFRKASEQEALGFQNARFASYQNVMEKAIKAAKDAGLNIEIDQVNGRYIYATKNGPNLVRPLSDLFTGLFANDPAIKEYYEAQAYVNRKDWVMGNAQQYGSESAAEQAYADQIMTGMQNMFGQMEQDINFQKESVNGQKRQYEERIRKNGTTPDSPLARQYKNLNQYSQELDSTGKVITETNGYIKNVQDPSLQRRMGANLDKVMASFLLQGDITNAAQTLAYRDYAVKMEADPYALENVKQANRLALEDRRFQNNLALEKFKLDPEAWERKQMAKGDVDQNVPTVIEDVTGASTTNLESDGAAVVYEEMMADQTKDFSASERAVLDDFIKRTKEQSKGQGENGQGIASDDLVALTDAMINEINTQEKYSTFDVDKMPGITKQQREQYGTRVKEKWDNMSKDEQVKFAQEFDFNKYLTADYSSGLSGTAVDNIYDSYVKPRIPKTEDEVVQREYLRDWYNGVANAENRAIIEHKQNTLDNLNDWFISENQSVLQKMKGDSEFDEYSGYLDYFFDENFKPRNVHDFAQAYYKDNPGSVSNPDDFARMMTAYYGEDSAWYEDVGGWVLDNMIIPAASSSITLGPDMVLNALKMSGQSDAGSVAELAMGVDDTPPVPSGEGLMKIWRNGFHKYASPDGGAMYLGLTGNDNYAARGIGFNRVDPVAYESSATMNTMGFFRDVVGANTGDVRFTLGGPENDIEDVEHNADLMPLFNQVYQDMLNRADPKDKKRPVLNVVYQDIAGSNRDWTALNIKFNEPYMTEYLGSEDNPGIFRDLQGDLRGDGMTIYLKKDGATNGFATGTSKTSLEHDLYWTGQHNISAYPDVFNNVRMVQNKDAGGFNVVGQVYDGLNENGTKRWLSINEYYPPGFSPDEIQNRLINTFGAVIQPAYEDEMSLYRANHPNFTTDPSQL